MANKVKYLQQKKLSDGTIKWVFNPPAYLKSAIGASFEQYSNKSDAVMRCVQAENQYTLFKTANAPQIIDPASVSGIIAMYKTTNAWTKLKPNSHVTYNQMFNSALWRRIGKHKSPFGSMLANNITNMDAQHLYTQLESDVSEHRARHTTKIMKRVFNVAEKLSKVRTNPFRSVELGAETIRDVLWKEEQVLRFIATADKMGYWSMGTLVLLCYDLCQRPGDMRQITWDFFDGVGFEFVQEKTGTKLYVEASPRLASRILPRRNQGGPNDTIVVYENTGRAYDNRMYNKLANQIRNLAILPSKLKIACLRHSGATILGESDATEDQISAVTGHKSRQMLNIYVKKTKRLAQTAQQKRFNYEQRQ